MNGEYIALVGTPHEMKPVGKPQPLAGKCAKILVKIIDDEFIPTAKKYDWPARDALIAVKEEIMKIYTMPLGGHLEWKVNYMNTAVVLRMERTR